MVTLSRLCVTPAAADKLKTRQQKKGKKCPVLVQTFRIWLKFSNKGLGRRSMFHELPERGWGKRRSSLCSCCLPQTWDKIIRVCKCKENLQSQTWMEKGPWKQHNLDKAGGGKHDLLVFGKGFSCCCSLFAGKSFRSWMLHSSSFPPQPSSRLFRLFFYRVEEIRHRSKKRCVSVSTAIQLSGSLSSTAGGLDLIVFVLLFTCKVGQHCLSGKVLSIEFYCDPVFLESFTPCVSE